MPDITDSPDGVHPHVKVDFVAGHPDGEVRLWVKQKFHVMGVDEALSIAHALTVAANTVAGAPPVATTAADTTLEALAVSEGVHAGA